MISRLRELEVADFRRVPGTHRIPLDSEIVVIYGPNGSGKTSIVQAIEYAITGAVSDLKGSVDYERVLQNQFSSSVARVRLTATDKDGRSLVFQEGLGSEGRTLGRLDGDVRRYFLERGYLSQRQLTRLLERYQAAGSDEDQVLVHYIQRLLQLDSLMSLSDGLHVAMDRRRLRKRVPALDLLEQQTKELRSSIDVLRKATAAGREWLASGTNELSESLGRLRHRVPEPLRLADDTALEAVGTWVHEVEQLLRKELAVANAEEERIEAQAEILDRAREAAASEMVQGDQRLAEAEKRYVEAAVASNQADERLMRHRAEIERLAAVTEEAFEPLKPDTDHSSYIEAAESVARRRLADYRAAMAFAEQTKAQIATLEDEIAPLVEALEDSDPQQEDDLERTQQTTSLLLTALDRMTGDDVCPVCARDFADTGKGHLRDELKRRISELQAAHAEAVARAKHQQAIARQLNDLRGRVQRMQSSLAEQPAEPDLASRSARLGLLIARIEGAAAARRDVAEVAVDVASARQQLNRARRDEVELAALRASLTQVRLEMKLPPLDGEPLPTLIWSTTDALKIQSSAMIERRELLEHAMELVRSVSDATAEVTANASKLANGEAQLSESLERLQKVERIEHVARKVAEASSRARAGALSKAIDGDLNSLWHDLFVRLVPSEKFVPRLSTPAVSRRKRLLLSALVAAEGVEPMESEPTLSAGNLNTAALCLFLAMNLVETPKTPIMVLDDPIQSMDDVHLVNFAGLIGGLSRDVGRQVILAVHERALYEYLMHELGPTREGDQTLGIEIEPDGSGGWSFAEKRLEWKVDEIRVS